MSENVLTLYPSLEESRRITEKLIGLGLNRMATGPCFPLNSWPPTTAPSIKITYEGEWIDGGQLEVLENGMLNVDGSGRRSRLRPLPERNQERLRLPNGREFSSIPEAAAHFDTAYANLRPEPGYATLVSESGELTRIKLPESGNFNEDQQLLAKLLDSTENGVSYYAIRYGAFGNQNYYMLLDREHGVYPSREGFPELLTRTLNPVATALWYEAHASSVAEPGQVVVEVPHLVYGPMVLLQDVNYPFDKPTNQD
jgi:hypothetical protein